VRNMAESELPAGVAVTLIVAAANDSIQFARLQTTAVAGRIGFDYDAIEDVRIAVSELCGTVISCASPTSELRLDISGNAGTLTVSGRAPLANGAALDRDDLSDQVLNVVTDDYKYDVSSDLVSFHMTRSARSAEE